MASTLRYKDLSEVKRQLISCVFFTATIHCSKCNAFIEADDEGRCAESAARQGWVSRNGFPLCNKCKHKPLAKNKEQ